MRILLSLLIKSCFPRASLSISRRYLADPDTLSRLLRPARIASISPDVIRVRAMLYPSIMEIPPPGPRLVTRGIPALQISSISRLMVLRDTSNFSAR